MTATPRTDPDVQRRVKAFAAALQEAGAIRSPQWAQVFATVPRHLFVPTFYTAEVNADGFTVWRPVDAGDERWLDAVYTDQTLVTALDPATVTPDGTGAFNGTATSSSTLPSLMAGMLEDLGLADGMKVLEIGTGTGFNAALLSQRVGADLVTSIDIAPELVAAARSRLAVAGYAPTLLIGDGRAGHETSAPFDRIISTASVTALPAAWITQVRPGGKILTDLVTGIEGGLVLFTADGHGTAEGRFTATTGRFMPARTSADSYPAASRAPYADQVRTRDTTVTGGQFRSTYPLRLLASFMLPPDTELVYHIDDAGMMAMQLQTSDGCWARSPLTGHPGEGTVTLGGAEDLWRRVEAAWTCWESNGQPDHTHIGITVDPAGSRVWWDPNDGGERVPLSNVEDVADR